MHHTFWKKATFNKDVENPTEKTSEGGSKKCVIIGGIVALAIIAVALLVGFFVFHRELKGMGDISKALHIKDLFNYCIA